MAVVTLPTRRISRLCCWWLLSRIQAFVDVKGSCMTIHCCTTDNKRHFLSSRMPSQAAEMRCAVPW